MELESKPEVTALVRVSQELQVTNQTQFEDAKEILLRIAAARKTVGEWWDPVVKKAFESHRESTKARKAALKPLDDAEGYLRPKVTVYLEKERAKLQHLDEKLRSEASARGLPVLESSITKDENIFTRMVTKYEVVDLEALVKAVANGVAPIECITHNDGFLKDMLKAMGEKMTYPGIRVYKESSLVVKQ